MKELAVSLPAECCTISSASAWWKAHVYGEIKYCGGSALFAQSGTTEDQFMPVGKVLKSVKMSPSKALVFTHIFVMEQGKKLICGSVFNFWLCCAWCRVVDGEVKSCMSWVLKWDFALQTYRQ